MKQRLTAWLTILAMLASIAWPVHARHVARAGSLAGDLCSAVGFAQSKPALPANPTTDPCAKCCACGGGEAAAAAATARGAVAASFHCAPLVAPNARPLRLHRELARVRGPPALA